MCVCVCAVFALLLKRIDRWFKFHRERYLFDGLLIVKGFFALIYNNVELILSG